VQSQIILDAMDAFSQREDDRWSRMTESIDLLFSRVADIDRTQQHMASQLDLSTKVMDQVLQDQHTLAKQMEVTSTVVARLAEHHHHQSSAPGRSDPSASQEVPHTRTMHTNHRHQGESSGSSRPYVPKMSFPLFTGEHPKIWKDKCLNYFSLCNVPESMWTIAASMHMDGPASKWLQVYKLRNGLGSWAEFIAAVEDQFGSYDYRDSIGDLVTLTQTSSLEDYVTVFVDLQYQVSMHNLGLDEIYFVTQFTTGLKPELRASVQSQVPSTMKKAILLAKVQQQLLDATKFKSSKFSHKNPSFTPKFDQKSTTSTTSTNSLWKERQL